MAARVLTLRWPKGEAESVKFNFKMAGRPCEGFVIRQGKSFKAYLNRCPHAGSPLDFGDNEFYTDDKQWLMCRTHGALFEPASGLCVGGPCTGANLLDIPVTVLTDGRLRLALPIL